MTAEEKRVSFLQLSTPKSPLKMWIGFTSSDFSQYNHIKRYVRVIIDTGELVKFFRLGLLKGCDKLAITARGWKRWEAGCRSKDAKFCGTWKAVVSRYYAGLEDGLAMQKIAQDDRVRPSWWRHCASRRSTPSAIIHVIVDNLFRWNHGECTAHVGPVAGNLVNIHVRIKPLASVSVDGSKGNGEERPGEGRRCKADKEKAKPRVGRVAPFNYSLFVTSLPW